MKKNYFKYHNFKNSFISTAVEIRYERFFFSFKGRFCFTCIGITDEGKDSLWCGQQHGNSFEDVCSKTKCDSCLLKRGGGGESAEGQQPTALEVSQWQAHMYMIITAHPTRTCRPTYTSQGNSDKRPTQLSSQSDWDELWVGQHSLEHFWCKCDDINIMCTLLKPLS